MIIPYYNIKKYEIRENGSCYRLDIEVDNNVLCIEDDNHFRIFEEKEKMDQYFLNKKIIEDRNLFYKTLIQNLQAAYAGRSKSSTLEQMCRDHIYDLNYQLLNSVNDYCHKYLDYVYQIDFKYDGSYRFFTSGGCYEALCNRTSRLNDEIKKYFKKYRDEIVREQVHFVTENIDEYLSKLTLNDKHMLSLTNDSIHLNLSNGGITIPIALSKEAGNSFKKTCIESALTTRIYHDINIPNIEVGLNECSYDGNIFKGYAYSIDIRSMKLRIASVVKLYFEYATKHEVVNDLVSDFIDQINCKINMK